jgi:phenylalanyl-tRNA synthetase beta chain
MKVSLQLAQYFSNVDLRSIPKQELLARIGAQLGAVEEVTDWAAKLEGAVIVKVISAEKHPNADKLSVCQVEDGSGQAIQVVCGAPNVRAGMYAVWLRPGVTVPSTRGSDPFVLEAREIRGEMSSGMLASAKELGIADSHEGILELDPAEIGHEPGLGDLLANYFGLDDFVVTCENKMFTHRPDCFGNLGVARELAGISGMSFQSPEWYLKVPEFVSKKDLPLQVKNDVPAKVPRFMAVVMSGVQVKPSPVWLQALLTRVGIKPINNVVDVTNYVMHLTSQPLHAFDYDKLKERSNNEPSLFPRMSQKGETLLLLGQKEITLTGEELVISTDKQAVALAGVMGGAETEVDENTQTIVLECATFDMYTTRRTSMRFGLFTDAVTRFNKGQSPLQNDRVLWYAMKNVTELAAAQQASDVTDIRHLPAEVYDQQTMSGTLLVSPQFINERLGTTLSGDELCTLLQATEFIATNDASDGMLHITAPFWRTDIEIPEDIVEEVGRLYGFDKLPVVPPKRSIAPATKNELRVFKQHLRLMLKQAGANEVLTYSFVHGDLLRKTGSESEKWAFRLRNALSPELQYYRTALMPSLLSKVHLNSKAQAGDDANRFALFEFGKVHVTAHTNNGLPEPMERLALVLAADTKTAQAHSYGAAYYQAKYFVDMLTHHQAVYEPIDTMEYPITASYMTGRSAVVKVNGEVLGVVGEFNSSVRTALKLPDYAAGFELDTVALQKYLQPPRYKALPAFPATTQDITLTANGRSYYQVVMTVETQLIAAKQEHGYGWQLAPVAIFKPEQSGDTKITLRISLWHTERTLTTTEVSQLLEHIAAAYKGTQQSTEV